MRKSEGWRESGRGVEMRSEEITSERTRSGPKGANLRRRSLHKHHSWVPASRKSGCRSQSERGRSQSQPGVNAAPQRDPAEGDEINKHAGETGVQTTRARGNHCFVVSPFEVDSSSFSTRFENPVMLTDGGVGFTRFRALHINC